MREGRRGKMKTNASCCERSIRLEEKGLFPLLYFLKTQNGILALRMKESQIV